MAGYAGYSKSNNAIEAESNGCYPLTTATKELSEWLDITKKAAKELLIAYGPSEWHHTSKHYNVTNYYNVWAVIENLADEGDLNAQGVIARKKARDQKKLEELKPNGYAIGACEPVEKKLQSALRRLMKEHWGCSNKIAAYASEKSAMKRYGRPLYSELANFELPLNVRKPSQVTDGLDTVR